jgi:hypothetical protein
MGIKIEVGADVGDLNSALQSAQKNAEALQSSLTGGHLTVETGEFENRMKSARQSADAFKKLIEDKKKLGVDTSDAEKQLNNVRNAISQSVKELTNGGQGKSKAETSMERLASKTKLATAEIKKQQEALRAMGRSYSETQVDAISRAHSRMRSGGGASSAYVQHGSFADVLGDKSGNAVEQNARKNALSRILQNAGVEKPQSSRWGGKGYMMAGAAGGALGSMMVGGTGGSVVGSIGSILGGGLGMLGGPLGMVAGSALGGALGGGIGNALGGAETESSGVADLRRSLGGVRVDFESLRASTRAAATGMGLTYAESLKLSREFTQISGSMGGKGLSGDINNSTGFARSLGLDPSQGVSFMATMRQFKADGGDTKRMSMVMAEAIEKGGLGSKAGELLSAVTNFASTAARQSLVAAPNIAGYAGMMSNLNSSGMPGMDVQGAASIMGRVDSAFRGNGSEATNNMQLAAFQNAFKGTGMGALEIGLIKSQGANGSARNAMQQLIDDPRVPESRKKVARAIKANPNSDRANVDLQMLELQRWAKPGTSEYEMGGATITGLSQQEFRGFDTAWQKSGSIGGMSKTLMDKYKINMSKVGASKHMTLASILGSDDKGLNDFSASFLKGDFGSLSKEEKDNLLAKQAGAKEPGGADALKGALLNLAKDKELVDIGTSTRNNVKDVENAVTKMSTDLTGATNAVRDAVLWVFDKNPKEFQKLQDKKANDEEYRKAIFNITGGRVATAPNAFGMQDVVDKQWTDDPLKINPKLMTKNPDELAQINSARNRALGIKNGRVSEGKITQGSAGMLDYNTAGGSEVRNSAGPLAQSQPLHATINVHVDSKKTTHKISVPMSKSGSPDATGTAHP